MCKETNLQYVNECGFEVGVFDGHVVMGAQGLIINFQTDVKYVSGHKIYFINVKSIVNDESNYELLKNKLNKVILKYKKKSIEVKKIELKEDFYE
jgi:hypothetical protein